MNRREFLYQRKNRCVGQLLDQLEKEMFGKLTDEEQKRVRGLVKTKIASYHRDVLDVMEVDQDTAFNAVAMKAKNKLDDSTHHR